VTLYFGVLAPRSRRSHSDVEPLARSRGPFAQSVDVWLGVFRVLTEICGRLPGFRLKLLRES
jgi:hypothetical protein